MKRKNPKQNPKRARCEWCGRRRAWKFLRRWLAGIGCKNEDECARIK